MAEPSLRTPLSTGPWRRRMRWAVRLITPWGVEWVLWKRSQQKERRRVRAAQIPEAGRRRQSFRVEEAIRFLVDRGLDAVQVREGSIPATSLDYLAEMVTDRLPSGRPLRALHVGNFVGVSLSYVTWMLTERHPRSLVVSIDPNIPHRGVEDPQSHTFALLEHFNMLSRNLIVNGYTLERTDESVTEEEYARAAACENVLSSLRALADASFDLVLIDGNHEEQYLSKEIEEIRHLLTPAGIVVLDDVVDWPGVAAVFERVGTDESFVKLGDDGRVGIVQVQSANQTHARR